MATEFNRFSMCNCLTVRMEKAAKRRKIPMKLRTYTAQLMTLDLFIKKVQPGLTFHMFGKDKWPKDFLTKYVIPKSVKTFLFSPFNLVHHPNYIFKDDSDNIRYVIPKEPNGRTPVKFNNLKRCAKQVNGLSDAAYISKLKLMDKKVDDIWGTPNKFFIFYDYSIAPVAVKRRAARFRKLSLATLDWPYIQVSENKHRGNKLNAWPHYTHDTYIRLLHQIEGMERQ